MEVPIVSAVTIDQHPAYRPMPDDPSLLDPPKKVELHNQAIWFLRRARTLPQGIGFCGIMAVHRTNQQQPGLIYLWPLQTPHEEIGGETKVVPGMQDLLPWPEQQGWPSWADPIYNTKQRYQSLKHFYESDKNLHVFAVLDDKGERQLSPAHAQLYMAVRVVDKIKDDWRIVGFSLYFNLNYVNINKSKEELALTFQPGHHLLRLMSRSQNMQVFPFPEPDNGKVPEAWASAIERAFITYFAQEH